MTALIPRRALPLATALLAVAAAAFAGAGPAQADKMRISTSVSPDAKAGRHADFTLRATFASDTPWNPFYADTTDGPSRLTVDLPQYLLGNPNAPAGCSADDFDGNRCPGDSYVGPAQTDIDVYAWLGWTGMTIDGGIYQLEPQPGELARLGVHFVWGAYNINIPVPITVEQNDSHRIRAVAELPRSHAGLYFVVQALTLTMPGRLAGSNRPYVTLPTACGLGAQTDVYADRPNNPGPAAYTDFAQDSLDVTDCASAAFRPQVAELAPEGSDAVDQPRVYRVAVRVPRDGDEDRIDSTVARLRVEFPPGLRLSPGVGEGLEACRLADFAPGDQERPAQCPDASEVGTVAIDAPELGRVPGRLFFGSATPLQEGGGLLMRVWLEAASPDGAFRLKAAGTLTAARDGRITADFGQYARLEPLPWDTLRMRFRTAAGRAPFVNPPTCGQELTARFTFTPWSGTPDALIQRPITTSWDGAGGACPPKRPFGPSFKASVSTDAAAAVPDAVSIRVTRPELHSGLKRVQIKFPRGMNPRLDAVDECGLADQRAHTCPPSTAVGRVTAAVGFGAETAALRGTAYLTPPRGAGSARGVMLALRAKVGAVDLGWVDVPGDVRLEPGPRMVIATDDIPDLVSGVPAPIRDLRIDLDGRANGKDFLQNPSACTPPGTSLPFESTLVSDAGQTQIDTGDFVVTC